MKRCVVYWGLLPMKRYSFSVFALFVVLCLSGCSAKRPAGDKELLLGEWICISGGDAKATESGRKSEAIGEKVILDQDRFVVKNDRNKTIWEATYSVDETSRPKSIDFCKKRKDGGIEVIRGIYLLEGDTLTICLPDPEEKDRRPTDFELNVKDGNGKVRYAYKRSIN